MNGKANSATTTFKLAAAIAFAALVCVATLAFTVSVPSTSGYFNIGETMIYAAALLFGPFVGAFAGGLGSAIADMIVAPVYFPGTLLIKGAEGAIVGFLNKKVLASTSKSNWRIYTTIFGIVVGILLATTGSIYYSGNVELYIGIPPPETPTLAGFVPSELWYLLGAAAVLVFIAIGFKTEPEIGRAVLSIIAGGLEMVIGYFLYQQIILNKAALTEIPINIGQMLVGLVVAVPLAQIVLRNLPQLKAQNP